MGETSKPAVVLDTNAVLDWRVFGDASMAALGRAIEAGALQWIATAPMLDELADVLKRDTFARGADVRQQALTFAHATTTLLAVPVPPLAGHPICRDRDDQKFIDLALAAPARWLVTRDKALLALRKAAAGRGVTVCTPTDWRSG